MFLPRTEESSGTPAASPQKNGWFGKLLLGAWILIALTGMASLSLGHMAAMPEPDDAARLSRKLLELRQGPGKTHAAARSAGAARAFYVHVIYAGCSCTERLFAHLVARGRLDVI